MIHKKALIIILIIAAALLPGCAEKADAPAAPSATATAASPTPAPDMTAINALQEAIGGSAGIEGGTVSAGGFTLPIEQGWMPADNYEEDSKLDAVDGVSRFRRGKSRLVVVALNPSDPPFDIDNELDVAHTITWNTSYNWMEYLGHGYVETPLGKAVSWHVRLLESAPHVDEQYLSLNIFIPAGGQVLNASISVPAAASSGEQLAHWQELGRMIAGAEYKQ